MLSQFNQNPEKDDQLTLRDLAIELPEKVVPLGRLDYDSEGLLLCTDERNLEYKLLHPKNEHRRRYHVLVEGEPTDEDLEKLRKGGVQIKISGKKHYCKSLRARKLKQKPDFLWPRNPPVRIRKHIADTWLMLELREGKNRQVRRMTAAVGFPTLRLVRSGMGAMSLDSLNLKPGQWVEVGEEQRRAIFAR